MLVGRHDGEIGRGVNPLELEPGAYQRHVGRAGDEQRHGERELDSLAGDLEDRSHGREHPAILAEESRGFFFAGFTSRLRLRDGLGCPTKRPEPAVFRPHTKVKLAGMAARNETRTLIPR